MPRVMEVHVDVMMHVDVVMPVEIMGPVDRSLDRSGGGTFVHMPDASMGGTVDERRLTVLYGCARGFAALCGLGTTALLLALALQKRPCDQNGSEVGPD